VDKPQSITNPSISFNFDMNKALDHRRLYLSPASGAHCRRAFGQRDGSRLLIYRNGTLKDTTFYHLPACLPPDAFLVLNNTRVLEARLYFEKPTGGVIEIFAWSHLSRKAWKRPCSRGRPCSGAALLAAHPSGAMARC
jgi:S-adenosylmethionine:tRNA-ribosyltransferase-isomerase (queuine synthetase)